MLHVPYFYIQSSTAPSLSVSVHGIPSVLGYGTPVWEDFAFGYRYAMDVYIALVWKKRVVIRRYGHCSLFIIDSFLIHHFADHFRRPEGDSCLNVEHCRAALQARLESLKSDKATEGTETAELCDRLQAQVEQVR